MNDVRGSEDVEVLARRVTAVLEGRRRGKFGAVIYREREVFRRRFKNGGSNGAKRVKDWAVESYSRARAVGFLGDYWAWVHLLGA